MTARERLEMIGTKIERAKEHFASVKKEVRTYLDSTPYSINTKRDPGSRRLIYFVEKVRPEPVKLSATLGDVVHNLRSALDHLAYQLVWVGMGKVPSSRIYFPIADDKKSYIEKRKWQMKGATSDTVSKIDALEPYRGGNDALWKLHKLDNVDKHRTLITAGSAFRSLNIGAHISDAARKSLAIFAPGDEALRNGD